MSEKIPLVDVKTTMPIEFRILVKVGKVEEKIGGIYLPESHRDKEVHHQIVAEYVRGGSMAFTDSSGRPLADAPVEGQKIVIAKYAGLAVKDKDDNLYRFANDKDVVAVIRE